MRRRLLTVGLVGIVGLLVILEVPLAVLYARHQHNLLAIRESAAAEVAARELTVAVRADLQATVEQTLALRRTSFRSYVVLAADGTVSAASGTAWAALTDAERAMAARAASGRTVRPSTDSLLPNRPMIAAAPISQGEDTVGAVVVISSTAEVRSRIVQRWLLLLAAGVSAAAIYVAIALPVTRWLIRPISELTSAALGDEHQHRRRVDASSGPPELRRLGHAFNEMTDSVERALESQRAFAADASHQLRNPLTSLRLRVENLGPHVTSYGAATLRGALGEVSRMEEIVGQLLDLARADEAGMAHVEIDVGDVAEHRVRHWRSRYPARNIELRLTSAAEDTRVTAQPGSIDHVLDVLLDNALKFSPSASAVQVVVDEDDRGVGVRVIDQGPGMTTAECERACERFWRGSTTQSVPGSGLGLSIAHRLVTHNGGTLHIRPHQQRGLEVEVRLRHAVAG